jgi:hypothetical protein
MNRTSGVLESLDIFDTAERNSDQQYPGAGQLKMAEKDGIVGFELAMDEYIVHAVIFSKYKFQTEIHFLQKSH